MAYTTIDDPTLYFNTKLYSGDGASTQAITGVNFRPDFVWIKSRNHTENHMLSDAVRGSTKRLRSDTTNAEDDLGSNGIQSFNTDGFTAGDGDAMNASGQTYASWNWLASNTTASNTDGSITSTVSANTTSGFSIVSYTGTGSAGTIGHGLNSTLSTIILKNRDDGSVFWYVFHKSLGNNSELYLNGTDSAPGSTGAWNTTSPTSSVFSVGSHGGTNASGQGIIAYCFAEKKGFSKFGSYTGNGNADGTFVFTGQKSAFIIIKNTSTSGTNWVMFDNKRIGYNESNYYLRPSGSNTESTNIPLDILSNGFKIRTSAGDVNTSGNTYIYMCFAESPFTTSTGIPTTAR